LTSGTSRWLLRPHHRWTQSDLYGGAAALKAASRQLA
jgi:hypothetical protein